MRTTLKAAVGAACALALVPAAASAVTWYWPLPSGLAHAFSSSF